MKKTYAVLSILVFAAFPVKARTSENWKKINTSHFEIIFREESTPQAEEVAGFCEEVYTAVTDFFESYPEKITCILRNRTDAANGYFSPVPPQINLFITSPSTPLISARNGNWLKVLLIHELTHYVNLTYRKGFFYNLSRLFGNSLAAIPAGRVPGWAVEGIAVKLETDLTDGGRGRNPFFEMKYKALIKDSNFYSWRKASYPSSFPPENRIYQAGYLINDYLSGKYGNDIFVSIYKNYLAHPLRSFNRAVLKTTGSSVKDIFAGMQKELENRYRHESGSNGLLVSPGVTGNYFLPDITASGWILYRNTLGNEPAIVKYDPVSKEEQILVKTSLTDFTSFSATSDGEKIIFSTITADGRIPYETGFTTDLFMLYAGTGKVLRLTRDAHLRQPGISDSGDRITAVQINGQFSRLVSVDPDTGETDVVFSKERTSVYNPSFSPDGTRIVFTLNDNGKQDIWILNPDGTAENLTAGMSGEKYFPGFSDNSTVIFSGDADGTLALYSADIKDTGKSSPAIKKICSDSIGAYSGTIYGDKIIYGSYTSRGYCIKTCSPVQRTVIESQRDTVSAEEDIHGQIKQQPEKSADYTDIPQPVLFFPVPFSMDPFNPGISLTPGFISYFRSHLGKFDSFLSMSMLTDPVQPEGELNINFSGNRIRTSYSLKQGYDEKDYGVSEQKTRQELSAALPVYSSYSMGMTRYLLGYMGIIQELTTTSGKNFSFAIPDTGILYGYCGLDSGVQRHGSPEDIIPPYEISGRGRIYLPVSESGKEPLWNGSFTLGIPSFLDHQTARFSGKIGYGETSVIGIIPSPRGFSINQNGKGRVLGAFDYLFTIVLADIPLLSGFSFQGAAGGIHIEKMMDFDITDPSLSGDSRLFSGAEITFAAGYMTVLVKAGIGFSIQTDLKNPESFDPERDLGIYFYAGTDSFKSSLF